MVECPECGSDEISLMEHAGPPGGSKLKCFGDCGGESYELDERPSPTGPPEELQEEDGDDDEGGQTTLADW